MTTLTFNSADEARAWDMYVAAFIVDKGDKPEVFAKWADAMILERRKRMAPLEPETFDGSVLTDQERAILDKAWRHL